MNLPLAPINKSDFLSKNYIYFTDINKGFNSSKYKDLILKESSSKVDSTKYFTDFLTKEYEKSTSPVYVDFYIKNLSQSEMNELANLLDEENKYTLFSLIPLSKYDTVFFEIKDPIIIPFLTKLSTEELFFTTFYFESFTLWGNFNLTFPIFYKDDTVLSTLSLPPSLTLR